MKLIPQEGESKLYEHGDQYRLLFEKNPHPMWIVDRQTLTFLAVNEAAIQHYGYTLDEFLSMTIREMCPAEDIAILLDYWTRADHRQQTFEISDAGVWRHRKRDGTIITVEITWNHIIYNGKDAVLVLAHDITQRKLAEERLTFLAHHDGLTDLPNRPLFMDRLNQALARVKWHQRLVAVLFLDLDHFKRINDSLGHDMGDLLLKAVAERLSSCVRAGDTVARIGGDEFTIVLADVAQAEDVPKVGQKIIDTISRPFSLMGQEFFITISMGISIFPNDGQDAQILVKNAYAAMYRAKEQGRNHYQYYSPAMNVRTLERLALESNLRHALARKELLLYYQPRVDLETGRITGVEALLRWQYPDLGLVSPSQFVPLAEETGLIIPIGEWVLRTACAQNKLWQSMGLSPVRVAVNLSARQFEQRNLVETIGRVIKETGLDPNYLELELTEGLIMKNPEITIATLRSLHEMGIQVSIDDFGTGYSSLSYLKRFPIHALKIDQSFVRDIIIDPDGTVIVTAIILLAHSLKLKVIAEGVETQDQLDFVRSLKCHEIQGYFFSKPLPSEEMTRLLTIGKHL